MFFTRLLLMGFRLHGHGHESSQRSEGLRLLCVVRERPVTFGSHVSIFRRKRDGVRVLWVPRIFHQNILEEHRMGEGTFMCAKVSIPGQPTTPKTVSLHVVGINRE